MPSGGNNRKSDDERRASGSYRPSTSSAARDRRIADNIYAGPGFRDVPDPEYPLGDFGQRKYFELAGRLLAEGKLSRAMRDTAEQVAILSEIQHQRMACGERVPAYLTRDISRHLAMLKLAEDTTPIGGNVGARAQENPFRFCGALLAPFAPRGLRGSPAAPA
ncbi:hypothetical protein [Methylobacterium dankookense]|uniref:Uncharacterized protein n=1 Tax=Methylobacterium dankookense TaxID=560405 RepID=A0A564G8T2_9HYPH|nr:hypothetical protein [Methylobacterium dankookense]GJD59608.1 hypothetical protein IFDJLNFL_5537 [Methylobacterium dankookense]VUF15951.1 hypothetical protein MTDSW087_05700 [Methylobacterium dankookense]